MSFKKTFRQGRRIVDPMYPQIMANAPYGSKARGSDPGSSDALQKQKDAKAASDKAATDALLALIGDDPGLMAMYKDRAARGLPQLTPDEISTYKAQAKQKAYQDALAGKVNNWYDDPARDAALQGEAGAYRKNALGDLAVQYQGAQTQTAQAAGRQGLLGGSVDIENRGALARANQAGAAGIESDTQGALREARATDLQSKQSLLASIYSTNPTEDAAAQTQLSTLGTGADSYQQALAARNEQLDANHFGNILQSQAYGNGLRALATSANQYAYSNNSGGSSGSGGW